MSKKKMPEFLYLKDGEVISEVAFDKGVKSFADSHKVKKSEALEVIADTVNGEELDYSDCDAETTKKFKALYAAADKFIKSSEANKKKLSEQLLEAEEADKKKGELIVKASNDGYEAAQKLELSTVSFVQKSVGDKFEVGENGMSAKMGVAISNQDLSRAIAATAGGSEASSKMRSKYLIYLGDSVNIAKKQLGEEEGENLAAQAVNEDGEGKHMAMRMPRVMAYIDTLFPDIKERPKLSATHFMESANYGRSKDGSNAIAPAKVKKILEKAVAEKLSCADLRDLLKAARPQTEPTGGEGGEDGDTETSSSKTKEAKALFGYLYIIDSDTIIFTEELDKEKLKEKDGDTQKYLVLDLAGKCSLKANAKKDADFQEVTEEVEELEEALNE